MCGIFGLVRNLDAVHPERASAVLVELGKLSVSRGRDSAGLAFIPTGDGPSTIYDATAANVRAQVADIQGVIIAKDTKTFDEFWGTDERYMPLLAHSALVIGHTRAATQGNRGLKQNSSPLAVGTLIGTHNGDISAESALTRGKRALNVGDTDTESLYRAIDLVNSHRRKITDILTRVRGRAALAWYDRRYYSRLYLARAALSPLATARDAEGNFYWASNPDWFRTIDRKFDGAIGFTDIRIIREGTLLTISFASGQAVVEDVRVFEPTARWSDTLLPESIVWRDFTEQDKALDLAQAHHAVTAAPKKKAATTSYSSASRSDDGWESYRPGGWSSGSTYGGSAPMFSSASDSDAFVRELDDLDEANAETVEGVYDDSFYDALIDEATDADLDASLIALDDWVKIASTRGVEPIVLSALRDASSDQDFERIAKDFSLPTAKAARIFAQEVLSHPLACATC